MLETPQRPSVTHKLENSVESVAKLFLSNDLAFGCGALRASSIYGRRRLLHVRTYATSIPVGSR